MTGTGRRFLAGIVTVLAAVAILVTLLAHYANQIAGDSGSFAGRAVSVVRSASVEPLIVDTVTNRVVAEVGNESSVQPQLESAVRAALSSGQISADVSEAAVSLQSELVSGTATRLTLTLPDLGPSIASRIESQSPALADEVRNLGTVTVVDVAIPPSASTAVHDLAIVGRDSTLLLILTVALAALALLISPSRARTLRGLGLGAAASGLLAAAVYLVGRAVVVNEFSAGDARTAAGAVWSTYLGGLEIWGFVLTGIGAAVALVATSRVERH